MKKQWLFATILVMLAISTTAMADTNTFSISGTSGTLASSKLIELNGLTTNLTLTGDVRDSNGWDKYTTIFITNDETGEVLGSRNISIGNNDLYLPISLNINSIPTPVRRVRVWVRSEQTESWVDMRNGIISYESENDPVETLPWTSTLKQSVGGTQNTFSSTNIFTLPHSVTSIELDGSFRDSWQANGEKARIRVYNRDTGELLANSGWVWINLQDSQSNPRLYAKRIVLSNYQTSPVTRINVTMESTYHSSYVQQIDVQLRYPSTSPVFGTMDTPSNTTYTTSSINISTTVQGADSCILSLDNTEHPLTESSNVWSTEISGLNNTAYSSFFTCTSPDGNVTTTPNTIFTVSAPFELFATSPSGTYTHPSTIDLNYYTNSPADSCWYSLDGGVDTTLPGCSSVSFSDLTPGDHSITIFANDSSNTVVQKTASFSLVPPTTPPPVGPQGGNGGGTYNGGSSFVLSPGITFINLPTEFSIVSGGEKDFSIDVYNSGNTRLRDASIQLIGIEDSWYETQSQNISIGKNGVFGLHIQIPQGEEVGVRNITLGFTSDKYKVNKTILFRITESTTPVDATTTTTTIPTTTTTTPEPGALTGLFGAVTGNPVAAVGASLIIIIIGSVAHSYYQDSTKAEKIRKAKEEDRKKVEVTRSSNKPSSDSTNTKTDTGDNTSNV